MWILPKQLHTSAFVPDTAALNLDSNESSQICAQSLFVRSKPSLARTWLRKWKLDSWTQHLFGRILKPSHGEDFVIAWISSLEATHASPSAQQESDLEQKTQDIFGPTSQAEFAFSDPDSASLKTSKDTFRWDSPASSVIWKKWVTQCRGEYSLRLKLAHLTSASVCSSWPTISVNESKNSVGKSQLHRNSIPLGTMVVMHGQVAPANPNTTGSRQGLWPTVTAHTPDMESNAPNGQPGTYLAGAVKAEEQKEWRTPTVAEEKNQNTSKQIYLQNQVGATVKQWATPQASDPEHSGPNQRDSSGRPALPAQAMQWGTPTARDHKSGRGNEEREYKELTPMVERTQTGKLNPRWVETLMGLPVGWTMPSCASPVTIEPMNSDF